MTNYQIDRVKRILLMFILFVMPHLCQAQTLEPLHVDGRYLKNPAGDIVTLHGYMTVLEPWFQVEEYRWEGYDTATCLKNKKAVIDRLLASGWKMDYVRFKLDSYWCCDRLTYNGEEYKSFDFERFKKYFEDLFLPLIDYYHEKGIYTLLWPPHTTPEALEAGDEFQQHMMLLWSYVSSHPRIKNNPGVLFELANEPINFNCHQEEYYDGYWGFMFDKNSAFREVRDYWQPIVDKIRSHCDNVIYVPGMLYESDHAGFADYPIKGENIGYAVHWYPGWWGNMRKDWEGHVFPIAYKAPIIITENAWAPYNNYMEGNSETSTSKFGKPLKDIVDELGNVSWNCYEPEEDYYYLVNSSSSSEKAVISNDPEACFKSMYQWWNDYSKTNVMPTSQLKAKAVSFDEFPTIVVPGQKSLAKIKAEFTNGMTWDVSGDAEYTIADESILSIKHGVIWALKEGSTTVTAKYTDGTGQVFSHEFEVTNTMFPLTTEGFNPNLHLEGSFDETTGTFSSESVCMGGWSFSEGLDLSAYNKLVVQLNQKQDCWAMVRIWDVENVWNEDEAWNDETGSAGFGFGDATEVVIDLQTLHKQNGEPLDLSHIYHVGIWINGELGSVSIKCLFLSNDGVTPANSYQEPTRVYADNKVMFYGDDVPDLTFSTSGALVDGTPTLSTTASSTSLIGTYPITIERGTISNDHATFIDGTLTILKRPMFSTEYEPEGLGFETAAEAVKNMKVGWNLWNTLDSHSGGADWGLTKPQDWETCWGNPVTKPELMKMMRKAGFNAIRVPVTWHTHMDANEQVDPEWMKRVHEVVDYVIDQGMYCILNTHHDNGAWIVADPENYEQYHERFEKLWQQIAEEFKDYDEHLVFEAYNEVLDKYQSWFLPSEEDGTMHVEQAYNALNAYAQSFVNVVRSTGGNNIERNLVINTYSGCVGPWNIHAESFEKMNIPKDVTKDHIIFGIHCYWLIINEDVDGILNNIRQYITSRGIPTIISEWGYDNITDLERYFLTETKNAGISTFLWGGMSSGLMRSFPAFDNSEDTKNFFKAYYGENYEPTLLTTGDYDKLKVTFKEYDAELGLFDGNNSPYSLDECTGLKVVLKDTPEKGKLQFNAWGENGLQTLEIQSKSATIIFDRSQIGEKLPLVTLQSKSQGSYVVEVDSIIAILNGEPYRKESIGWSHHDCDVVHLRKQFVHTVEYDGLYSELNIFSDDIPLQLKNYKGIRLELAEVPEDGTFLIHVYGNEDKENDYLGLTGSSTTIMFNPGIFSKDINRVTLQYLKDGKTEIKVISAWLIRQDGTEEYSDLSPFWGCEIKNVENYVPEPPIVIGDGTGDGVVDISDYIGVANYILGIPQTGFNADAADVNKDGVIDISDYIGVANIILTGKP